MPDYDLSDPNEVKVALSCLDGESDGVVRAIFRGAPVPGFYFIPTLRGYGKLRKQGPSRISL